MECSPVCDYAQRKRKTARFLVGIKLSGEDIQLLKKKTRPEYLIFSPIFEEEDENLILAFDARILVSCSLDEAKVLTTWLRMREPYLFRIQQALFNHASRIGAYNVQPQL